MLRSVLVIGAVAGLVSGAVWLLSGAGGEPGAGTVELLNVSCDPTRELWADLNNRFTAEYGQETGTRVVIKQSHGGSATQARSVIDGLEADVVSLAIWPDTDSIRRAGLIDAGWEDRYPHRSLPYFSTIVFVVRKGNPKGIKDWPDLVKGDVKVITPNPKTSGNGRLSFLAAWGAVTERGGSEADANRFVTDLYRRVPVLDSGARGSTTTFSQKKIGDVHLTWENEAHLEVQEAQGELEIVYPPISIRAEPHVAAVDANVRRKGTEAVVKAYLDFLYTDRAQEIFASHHYRPTNETVLAAHQKDFPEIKLFPVTAVARDWDEAQWKFFAEGGEFDRIYQK